MQPHKVSPVLWIGIAVVIVGAVMAAVVMAGKNTEDDAVAANTQQQATATPTTSTSAAATATPTTAAEADLVLQNLGLKNINSATVYTRFAVQDYTSNGMKGFYIFGDSLPGNRLNPTFEYASVKEDASVVAAIDGVVVFVKEQSETNDYEVFLQPKDGSIWTVGYDHLVGVKVKKGDTVKAGDALGTAAVQNNGLYRFELQINKDVAGVTTHYCPVSLLDPAVSTTVIADITAVQTAWEAVKSQDLYNPALQSPVGCLKPTLSVAQAEGR